MDIFCNHHVASFDETKANDKNFPLKASSLHLPKGKYKFMYSYPLRHDAIFVHEFKGTESAIDILKLGRADYEAIYKEDEKKGTYGVWGHDISDLYFENVVINLELNTVEFSIGS